MEQEYCLGKLIDRLEYCNNKYDEALEYMEKNNIKFKKGNEKYDRKK